MKRMQYTVRNIPPNVDKVLRRRAYERGKSLNATVVEALKGSAGVVDKPVKQRDLGWFYGSGGIGREEETAFRAQRAIDWKAWR